MIIDTKISVNKKGVVVGADKKALAKSNYKPTKAVKDITTYVLKRFTLMNTAKTKPYREFNNMSLMERQSIDQVRFNSYQFNNNADPDDDWKSNAVRPITRNQVIAIAAHITGSIMYPQVFAQNENAQDDKDSALVMRELMEWSTENSNPVWERTFVFATIAALVNPAVFIHTEYAEVYRTVKMPNDKYNEKKPAGPNNLEFVEQEILDEEYSGFCDTIMPLDEVWMPDFHQFDVQKQPDFIWRKAISFDEAEEKYGKEANFKYVKPGIQVLFVEDNNLFYEAYDPNLRGELVEEIIYWNRAKDLELSYCNGVIMCKHDRPNKREDKKLPVVKMGYEIVDEGKFAFFKSMVNKLGPDEEVVQVLYRMIIDGTYLQLYPPSVVFGDEAVDASIMAPATVTTLSADTKFQALNPGNNLQAGMAMLQKVETSMIETSIRQINGGTRMTAYEVQALENQTKTLLGLFNRMIGFGIRDFYVLRINDILQHLTVGNVMDIVSESDVLKFRSFIMNDRVIDGKKKNRMISFKSDIFNADKITKKQKQDYEFKLLSKVDENTELIEADPLLFKKRKFKIKVAPDMVTPPSDITRKALNLEEYDRAIANPLANQEAVFRDLLLGSYDATKGDPDKYIQKQQKADLAGLIGADGSAGPGETPPGGAPGKKAPQAPGNSATAMMSNQRLQESAAQMLKAGAK